jgi:hypothetical protein
VFLLCSCNCSSLLVALHVAPICRECRGRVGNAREFSATGATRKPVLLTPFRSNYLINFNYLALAGELGFEPRQTESESVVLPLHHSPRIAERNQ